MACLPFKGILVHLPLIGNHRTKSQIPCRFVPQLYGDGHRITAAAAEIGGAQVTCAEVEIAMSEELNGELDRGDAVDYLKLSSRENGTVIKQFYRAIR